MPTEVSILSGFGVAYENAVIDKEAARYGTSSITGAAVTFELAEIDKRYYEFTKIDGFGIAYEFNPLIVDSVVELRL